MNNVMRQYVYDVLTSPDVDAEATLYLSRGQLIGFSEGRPRGTYEDIVSEARDMYPGVDAIVVIHSGWSDRVPIEMLDEKICEWADGVGEDEDEYDEPVSWSMTID